MLLITPREASEEALCVDCTLYVTLAVASVLKAAEGRSSSHRYVRIKK